MEGGRSGSPGAGVVGDALKGDAVKRLLQAAAARLRINEGIIRGKK